jgi:hypothetical protein
MRGVGGRGREGRREREEGREITMREEGEVLESPWVGAFCACQSRARARCWGGTSEERDRGAEEARESEDG